jgi:hypothetical protein
MNEGTVGAVYKGTESDATLQGEQPQGRPKYLSRLSAFFVYQHDFRGVQILQEAV